MFYPFQSSFVNIIVQFQRITFENKSSLHRCDLSAQVNDKPEIMNKMMNLMFPLINAASIFFQRKEIAKVINAVKASLFWKGQKFEL